MSSVTYEELLREALVDLSEMQEQDGQSLDAKLGRDKRQDLAYFMHHWSAMYLRYVQIARKLAEVHDQLLQPQKRRETRVLLDSCVGRMVEMKHKIVEFCGEYINLDEALVDLKLTPDALEIPIPRYFVEERAEELVERRKYIRELQKQHHVEEAFGGAGGGAATAQGPLADGAMTVDRAIAILQCCERGRQGRQRAKFLKSIYEQEQHQTRDFEYGSTLGKDEAATKIQKIVLGYLARKEAQRILKDELEFLGMEPSASTNSTAHRDRLAKTLVERKTKQKSNEDALQQETRDMRARIKLEEGGKTMEEMLDEVLLHLAKVRELSKEDVLPAFPTEEEGGSLALLGRLPNQPTAEEEAAAAKKAAEEAAAAAKKPAAKEPQRKNDKNEAEEELPRLAPSVFWPKFTEAREKYVSTWHPTFQRTYFDDKDFDQQFDKDLLRRELLEGENGTLSELRKCVDQLVMVEVNNLRERMERERGIKKKKKGAKGKAKGAKGKGKKKPDPLGDKKIEVHMNTLVYLNVLQLPDEKVRLVDYVGAHNMMDSVMDENARLQAEQQDEVKAKWQTLLNNWNEYVEKSLRMTREQFELLFKNYCNQTSWMFEPSMMQVRQAVVEYCILPLGSQMVHDMAPHHNAVLFYGFAKSGKTLLTQAVCNEAGANLFNLSPSIIGGRDGANTPNLQKLVQTVFRVARIIGPSVIYIDQAELVFAGGKGKKKKKGDPTAAKAAKMKKDILKEMKELEAAPSDRVVVIGNSRCPWEADMKELCSFFRAMICCCNPDYASRMLLWQSLTRRKGVTLPSDHDYEMLAFMTNKYTSGTIAQIIDETLTERRVKRVAHRPVKADEFLPALSRAQPIFKEDYEAMKEFVLKLPLTMRRATDDDFKAEVVEDPKKGKKGK